MENTLLCQQFFKFLLAVTIFAQANVFAQPAIVIQVPDGGYLIGGISYSGPGGYRTASLIGKQDFGIIRLNAVGEKIWDKSFRGSEDEMQNAISPTMDGGFIPGCNAHFTVSPQWDDYDILLTKIPANVFGKYRLSIARNKQFQKPPIIFFIDEAHQYLNKNV